MDVMKAIEFAQLVNAAYSISPNDLADSAGKTIAAGASTYTVVSTIYAYDLATDINPGRGNTQVSIGLICQANGTSDIAIAIRGTEGIEEWLQDAAFLLIPCPILPGSGHTEDGFTDMYNTLRIGLPDNSPSVVNALGTLPFAPAAATVTICGHSLGGALATLLALDVAANSNFKTPTVYTYGSPRTGDPGFVSTYNQLVKNTFRVANRMDLVPKLPLPPIYEHVLGLFEVNPLQLLPFPPRSLVKPTIACEHVLNSYLHLLSVVSGGPVLPLDQTCAP